MVRSGASTYWLRAALPTSSRPCGSRPTTDGRIGSPSSSENDGLAVANDGDLAVGRPQVDADDGVHEFPAMGPSRSGDEGIAGPRKRKCCKIETTLVHRANAGRIEAVL